MAAVTQTDVLQKMSYLLGESSVPTSGIEDRQSFIQSALERTLRIHDFKDVRAIATVSITSGVGTMPTDMGFRPPLDVRVINSGTGDDYIFDQIPYEERDNWGDGDYKYWITGSEGAYSMNTNDGVSAVTVRYGQLAPTINASVSTTFPSATILARGALVYYLQAEDPQADISVPEALFQKELQELIARENRNKPLARAKTIQEKKGLYTGYIGDI